MERAAEESERRTRIEAEKQEAAEQKNSDGKLTKLQQELTQVRGDYAEVLSSHRDGEQALRKVSSFPPSTYWSVFGCSAARLIE